MSKNDVVVSPFSVITDTPPRGLSYEIMENPSKCYDNIKHKRKKENQTEKKEIKEEKNCLKLKVQGCLLDVIFIMFMKLSDTVINF